MRNLKRTILRLGRNLLEESVGVEIESRRFYPHLHRLRTWLPSDIIFDVGANDGRTIKRLRRHLDAPTIYAFEPAAATYQTLLEETRSMSHVRGHQIALGATAGRREIYLDPVAAVHSLNPDWGSPVGTENVEVTTVDDFMEHRGLEVIHFIKLDTEGFDLETLKGASKALSSSRIEIIQVEAGFDQVNRPYTTLEEFRRYLAPFGYYVYGIFNQVRRRARPPRDWRNGRKQSYHPKTLAYCDAVFLCGELTDIVQK